MTASPRRAAAPRPARVLIADDSAVVRGLLSRWIEATEGLEVAGTAPNGRAAITLARTLKPDIVLLDLDMPELGGLEALPGLLEARPGLSVVVVSTLTQRNAEISLRCLQMGAVDVLPKPRAVGGLVLAEDFRREMVAKLRGLAASRGAGAGAGAGDGARPAAPAIAPARSQGAKLVVIGASTGGPRAVIQVVGGLAQVAARLPILVVQHMPAVFTGAFARQIEQESGIACREAQDGEDVRPGAILVAPGGRHLGLATSGGATRARLLDGPPLHHCRPSLDVSLADAAGIHRGGVVAVVLTGMGTDGLEGAAAVRRAGGTVLVQDAATSVVWGMPGSIARAGLADAVLPLGAIAIAIAEATVRSGESGQDAA